jgi:iron-sulfur cluster assembly accessory protein
MTENATSPVQLSERAARRIAAILSEENKSPGAPVMLRVSVSGGGCSGFQYGFDFDRKRAEDDLVLERDGAVVLIDSTSLPFLEGAEIDFVDELIGASFQIKNPNAASSCGCGTSFAI